MKPTQLVAPLGLTIPRTDRWVSVYQLKEVLP
jgi:hypothetical protein